MMVLLIVFMVSLPAATVSLNLDLPPPHRGITANPIYVSLQSSGRLFIGERQRPSRRSPPSFPAGSVARTRRRNRSMCVPIEGPLRRLHAGRQSAPRQRIPRYRPGEREKLSPEPGRDSRLIVMQPCWINFRGLAGSERPSISARREDDMEFDSSLCRSDGPSRPLPDGG